MNAEETRKLNQVILHRNKRDTIAKMSELLLPEGQRSEETKFVLRNIRAIFEKKFPEMIGKDNGCLFRRTVQFDYVRKSVWVTSDFSKNYAIFKNKKGKGVKVKSEPISSDEYEEEEVERGNDYEDEEGQEDLDYADDNSFEPINGGVVQDMHHGLFEYDRFIGNCHVDQEAGNEYGTNGESAKWCMVRCSGVYRYVHQPAPGFPWINPFLPPSPIHVEVIHPGQRHQIGLPQFEMLEYHQEAQGVYIPESPPMHHFTHSPWSPFHPPAVRTVNEVLEEENAILGNGAQTLLPLMQPLDTMLLQPFHPPLSDVFDNAFMVFGNPSDPIQRQTFFGHGI